MKKILILFTLLVINSQLHAQGNDHKSGDGNNYCIQNDGNKISVIYQGIPIASDIILDNGTTVKSDGTLITKDKKTTVLREGQCINRDGTISISGGKERQIE